jgi:AraC-like DNA-binding protein
MAPLSVDRISALPLSRYSLVDTRDPSAAEAQIGRIFCSHRLTPTHRGAPRFHAIHNNAGHDGFSINYVAYGADVEIDPGCLDRFFLLQIPLAGTASVRCGAGAVEASPETATLLSPTLPTVMRWREGAAKLIVLIDRRVVESHLAGLIDRGVEKIEFAPAVRLNAPAGAALRAQATLIQTLDDQAVDVGRRSPLAHRQLRDSLVGLMLAAQPHSYSEHLTRPCAPPAPAHVKRAEAFIEHRAREDFSVVEVARAAGVGLRTLQAGFRQFRERSLSEAILDARLELWRRALHEADRERGIAELAAAAGLAHAGRAAAAYRRRYGESPSATRGRIGRRG